jgi:hypothetical protein
MSLEAGKNILQQISAAKFFYRSNLRLLGFSSGERLSDLEHTVLMMVEEMT